MSTRTVNGSDRAAAGNLSRREARVPRRDPQGNSQITAATISFIAPATIADSGAGFTFRAGDTVEVIGAGLNSRQWQIALASASALTVVPPLLRAETAGAPITIVPLHRRAGDVTAPPAASHLTIAATVTPAVSIAMVAPHAGDMDFSAIVTPGLSATLTTPDLIALAATVTPTLAASLSGPDQIAISATVTPSVAIAATNPDLIAIAATVTPTASITATSGGEIWDDGMDDATPGDPNFPDFFTDIPAITVRPPWNVAGVDYRVGLAAGATLTPWNAMSGAGITVNADNVRLDGDGHVIDGIDFTGGSGGSGTAAYLYIVGDNTEVKNCKTGGPGAKNFPNGVIGLQGGQSGLHVHHCDLDGEGASDPSEECTTSAMVIGAAGPGGSFHVHHNKVTSQIQHFCETGADDEGAVIIEYNMVHRPRIGFMSHGNLVQLYDGLVDGSHLYRFNVYFQDLPNGAEGPQGYFGHREIESTIDSPTFSFNVFVALLFEGDTTASYMIHAGDDDAGVTIVTGTRECSHNYFYIPGAFGPFYPGSLDDTPDDDSNIDMATGDVLPLSP